MATRHSAGGGEQEEGLCGIVSFQAVQRFGPTQMPPERCQPQHLGRAANPHGGRRVAHTAPASFRGQPEGTGLGAAAAVPHRAVPARAAGAELLRHPGPHPRARMHGTSHPLP